MITVYRPDGVAELKHKIDAQECVRLCGYSMTPPKEAVVVKEEPKVVVPDVDVAKMSADELREYLTSKGVEFHHLTGEGKLRTLVQKYLDEQAVI